MNLGKMGVWELNSTEYKNIGGGWGLWAFSLLGAMINDAQNNPDDFAAGFNAATW